MSNTNATRHSRNHPLCANMGGGIIIRLTFPSNLCFKAKCPRQTIIKCRTPHQHKPETIKWRHYVPAETILIGLNSFTNTRRSSNSPRKIPATHPKKKGAIMVQLKIPEELEPRNTQKYTPATWGA